MTIKNVPLVARTQLHQVDNCWLRTTVETEREEEMRYRCRGPRLAMLAEASVSTSFSSLSQQRWHQEVVYKVCGISLPRVPLRSVYPTFLFLLSLLCFLPPILDTSGMALDTLNSIG